MRTACNICGHGTFIDMRQTDRSIFVRKGVVCENCHSLERHRLVFAFLKDRGLLTGNRRVLHIAPERCLAPIFRARFGKNYIHGDKEVGRYCDRGAVELDLCQDLDQFSKASFDLVIHNHVIEHIACDYQPVLKTLDSLVTPGGWHILSVPFMPGGYREASSEHDESWRIEHCGQWDHRRIFSPQDFHETLGAVLAIPDAYDATRHFSPERLAEMNIPESAWYGLNNNAVFFLHKAGLD